MDSGPFFPSDRPSRKALYPQVRDLLTERIASGVWKPGEPIANVVDLARQLGVSSGTVRKALELMEAQRVIRRRQGRGTFVNDQTSIEQAARFCNFRGPDGERVNGRVVSLEIEEGAANDAERRRLQLAAPDRSNLAIMANAQVTGLSVSGGRVEGAVAQRGLRCIPHINETPDDGFFPMPLAQDDAARASSARCYLTGEVRRRRRDRREPRRRSLLGRAIRPGRWCANRHGQAPLSDEELAAAAAPMAHPVGTCAIGRADDPMAVVDPACRVYGTANLRVVDASIMPRIPSANTNLPTLMIAERAADLIRAR